MDFYRRTFDFYGSCSLRSYIYVLVMDFIVEFLVATAFGFTVLTIFTVIKALPHLSIMIRRFHNTGRTAKMLFWILVPIFGWFAIFGALFQEGVDDVDYRFNRRY